MRILYVSDRFCPGADGGSVHTWEVAHNLARLGHQVTLLVNQAPGQTPNDELDGIPVFRARMELLGRNVFPCFGLRWFSQLRRLPFDLVMERYATFGGVGTLLSRAQGIPLVLEVNSPHTEELIERYHLPPPFSSLLRAVAYLQFAQSTAIVAPLPSIVPPQHRAKVTQIHWAANASQFHPEWRFSPQAQEIRARYQLGESFVVLFVGTFHRWHGATDIPAIAEFALKLAPQVKFLLVGEGRHRAQAEAEARQRGVEESIIFAGQRPYAEMPAIMAAADVGLAPYNAAYYPPLQRFGFFWSPLKIFEYMASGLPTITTDYPPLREILGPAGGMLLPQGDLAAYGAAIAALSQDQALCQRLGQAARERVLANFTWERHAQQLDALLHRLVPSA